MCGIAGVSLRQGMVPDADVLKAMTDALRHRGPDGSGQYVSGNVALAHTRLSIIDLTGGDQPLHAGGSTLVGNGEIYNYRELKTAHALKCATASDCEPPLHLFRREGAQYTSALRGMYALAIHDKAQHRLILSRDTFGIKPLYLTETSSGVAFASEPQALLAANVAKVRLRSEAVAELAQLQFTTGSETIFSGIHRVLPGETVVVSDGSIVERTRTLALADGGTENLSEAEALDRLDSAVRDSIDLHQRSDVPYGMFLSSGVDSSAVLSMMAELNDRPVRTFTAGFDVAEAADERAGAARIAAAVGAKHVAVTVTEADVWKHLPQIVACMDDPAADYAIIPTWFLARRAREDVKVVLSGEGGDELFGGYGRYRAAMRPWWLGGKAMRARGIMDRLDMFRNPVAGWRDGIAAAEISDPSHGYTRLQAAQVLDTTDWLPNDLLLKLDRCLMAHGVEGRTPLLDRGIAAAVFRLPDAMKVRDGAGKWILRQWLDRRLPAAEPFRKKQGFTPPIGVWIANVADRLAPLVAAQTGVHAVFKTEELLPLFRAAAERRNTLAAWNILFYALWHRRHVENGSVQGDVFEALAR